MRDRVDDFLREREFEEEALPENYLDEPPSDLEVFLTHFI